MHEDLRSGNTPQAIKINVIQALAFDVTSVTKPHGVLGMCLINATFTNYLGLLGMCIVPPTIW